MLFTRAAKFRFSQESATQALHRSVNDISRTTLQQRSLIFVYLFLGHATTPAAPKVGILIPNHLYSSTPMSVLTTVTLLQGGYLSIWEWSNTSSALNLTLWLQRPLCSCGNGNYQDDLSRFQNVGVDEKSKYSIRRCLSSGHLWLIKTYVGQDSTCLLPVIISLLDLIAIRILACLER
jgi:hypothetical protein